MMSQQADTQPDSLLAGPYHHSPNFGERKQGCELAYIVLHYTGMDSGEAALARLMDPESEVSCHYLIWEDGRIQQLVAEDKRAWHAGQSEWNLEKDMNSASIGIELVHEGHDGAHIYPEAQIQAVIALCRDICERRSIPLRNILAHSDIAPLRKQDPGEFFPWDQLHAAGLGWWVEPAPFEDGPIYRRGDQDRRVGHLQCYLALIGYRTVPTAIFDEATEAVLKAFQRHFRPSRVDGIADVSTFETIKRLLAPPLPSYEELLAMHEQRLARENEAKSP
jgi:N-acetylmuramoyl-L-alanine amidase